MNQKKSRKTDSDDIETLTLLHNEPQTIRRIVQPLNNNAVAALLGEQRQVKSTK